MSEVRVNPQSSNFDPSVINIILSHKKQKIIHEFHRIKHPTEMIYKFPSTQDCKGGNYPNGGLNQK